MKVIELFAGVGSQTQALKNLGIEHEVVAISEIDKYAIETYKQLHGDVDNLGDISKIQRLPKADLWTYSFPCQDLSIAGKLEGIKKGTRSGLLMEVERLLDVAAFMGELPKYLLLENVKNLVSKRFKSDFDKWLQKLETLGYTNYWQVLNAKDYGIPQNRERVFCVSILGNEYFEFPKKQELKLRLKDMLEEEVDEKYYLSERMLNYVLDNNETQQGTKWEGRANNDTLNSSIAHAISVRGAGGSQRAGVSNFVIDNLEEEIKVKDVKRKYGIFDTEKSKHQAGSVYDENGLAPTLDTMQGGWRQPCVESRGVATSERNKDKKTYTKRMLEIDGVDR